MTLFFLLGRDLDQYPQPDSIDELLTFMTNEDPNTRPSAQDCAAHGWFANGVAIPNHQEVHRIMTQVAQQLAPQNPPGQRPVQHVRMGESHEIREV